jgi:methylenetetrahydrofolate dehydrogenase (NADP+)/methenyltetrahydrofolate cyclohydrolase/formyltetrahydrofolate synthetase
LSAGADQAVPSNHWARGGEGAVPLAEAVIKACEGESEFEFLYDVNLPLDKKIEIIAKEMYGADGIELSEEARQQIDLYTRQGESRPALECDPKR